MLHDNAWSGRPCFVVGGGRSLETFDWLALRGQSVLAINRAIFDVPQPEPGRTLGIVGDLRFLKRFADRLRSWPGGAAIFPCFSPGWHGAAKEAGVRTWCNHDFDKHRSHRPNRWLPSPEQGFPTAGHTGALALLLAASLAPSAVFLAGFDYARGAAEQRDGKTAHYHRDYPELWRTPDSVYEDFRAEIENGIAPFLEEAAPQTRVYNLNRDSALTCWPKPPDLRVLDALTPAMIIGYRRDVAQEIQRREIFG